MNAAETLLNEQARLLGMAEGDLFKVNRLLVCLAFVHQVTDRVVDAQIVVGPMHLTPAIVPLQRSFLNFLLL